MALGGFLEYVRTQHAQQLLAGRGDVVAGLPLAHRRRADMTQPGDGGSPAEEVDDLGNVHAPIVGDPNSECKDRPSEDARHSEEDTEYAYGMLKDRLKLAMDGPPKVQQVDLARAVGVAPPTVNDWLSGKSKSIRGQYLVKVARELGVSPDWLATGRGPMTPSPPVHTERSSNREKVAERIGPASHFGRPDPAILVSAGVTLDLLETTEGRPTLLPPNDLPDWLEKLAAMYVTVEEAGGELTIPQLQALMRAAIERRNKSGVDDGGSSEAGNGTGR